MSTSPRAGSRFGPSSLLARTNLTLGVSSLLIVAIATGALNLFVIDPISERSADDQAALLVLSAQTWVELPPEARPYFELELAQSHDLIVSDEAEPLVPVEDVPPNLALLETKLEARLEQDLSIMRGEELVYVTVNMGGIQLHLGFAEDRSNVEPLYGGVVIVALGAVIVLLTSFFIVRRIARPLVRIAKRVERFRGRDDFDPLPEQGPAEFVSLAQNFNTMAREISTLLANRTTLLAGISHDLRTPLARMRLALELLPDNVDPDLTARFERNLVAMDELIGDALRFARGAFEQPQPVYLDELVRDVAGSFEVEVPVQTSGEPSGLVAIAAGSLQRVLLNLVSNGIRHAKDVRIERRGLRILVVDRGEGIPPEHRETVFQPFFRLDDARTLTAAGSGLGLAIVAQLCEAHGWKVAIAEEVTQGTCIILELSLPDQHGVMSEASVGPVSG